LLYPQGRSPSYSLERRLAIQIETKDRFGSTKDEMTLHSVELDGKMIMNDV
jgi:hypothetical protein